MSPRCIVSDLDRTLTGRDLRLDPAALDRIRALRAAGVRVVVATGRRYDDVMAMGLGQEADGIVAENGAVVRVPSDGALQVLGEGFARDARAALGPLADRFAWGLVVGSGPRGLAAAASEALARAGVAHAIEFNAEEAMLLPAGVSKASGADACLRGLGLRAEDAWAIGDGENDAALLRWARVGAAPANAAPAALEAANVLLAASYAQAFLDLTDPLLPAEATRAR